MNPQEIKQIRQSLGLSQAGLAQKLGCRKATVSDWERGIKQVSAAYGRLLNMLQTTSSKEMQKVQERLRSQG